MSEHETTPRDESELIELSSPPAPPTRLERPSTLEGDEATEDGAGNAAPAPSSPDTEEDESSSSSSPVSIRERLRELNERDAAGPGSPGLGVVGKFSEARADRDAQDDERA